MTLREARDIAGLTRDRLAELSGTTATTIYDIETGRNARPSHETVVRIVRALQRTGLAGVTAEQLFPVQDEAAAS
jgi:transcriptional regulator with XRE-family HTH domain